MPRIVVTLTTLPSRIRQLTVLVNVLQSLNNQTITPNAIYLTIPTRASRLNKRYPRIPAILHNLCTIVRAPYDFGPVTKLYGGLASEQDEETIIISCDDDIIYPSTLIEELVGKSQLYPHSVIASSGVILGKFPYYLSFSMNQQKHHHAWWFSTNIDDNNIGKEVDLICGYAGVLYKRSFFPKYIDLESSFFSIPLRDSSLFLHDDVFISSYLCNNNIERRIFRISDVANKDSQLDSLSGNMLFFITSYYRAISYCQNKGWLSSSQELKIHQSLTGPIFASIMVIVFIIIIILMVKISSKNQ